MKRVNVDSDQPKDEVVSQEPSGTAAPGATVTLSVSKGPKQATVPDVTSQDEDSARSTLQSAGFTVAVQQQDVGDPGLDGIVLSQSPRGGTKADKGSTVTIAVGRLRAGRAASTAVSRKTRVAVLLGGKSSEHEISLASARSVLEALDPERYEAVTVEIGRDGRWELGTGEGEADGSVAETLPVPTAQVPATLGEVDVVFPVLHGPFGEDGTVQGLLELAGVPYVGAGVLGSALAMDKDVFKAVMRDRGVPVTRNITLRRGQAPENPFGYPVFVKPARLGSSVGISKVASEEELPAAVELAFQHDEKVLVEEFVDGVEVECGVLGNDQPLASLPGEIVSHGFGGADWYDYSAKYDEGGMDLIVPPRLPQETVERVQELAVSAFVAGECEGMARVDFFVRGEGEVLLNELNTIPGFTATSVYAKLFEASGIPYPELVDRLVQLAVERHERRSRLRY